MNGRMSRKKEKSSFDVPWWGVKSDDLLLDAVKNAFSTISDNRSGSHNAYVAFEALYANRDPASLQFVKNPIAESYKNLDYTNMPLNLSKMVVDLVLSKVSKHRVRAVYQTTGGDSAARQRADGLQRWTDTQFHNSDVHRLITEATLDACIYGDGFLKVFNQKKDTKIERVHPAEIYVDQVEAYYDTVTQIFQRKMLPRSVVMAMVSGKEKKRGVMEAAHSFSNQPDYSPTSTLADVIEVVEAWHLPSEGGASDGRHIIICDGAVLFDEKWELDRFPFIKLSWSTPPRGYYGTGIVADLFKTHLDVNRLLGTIQENTEQWGNPKVAIEISSRNEYKEGISDLSGEHLFYKDRPPQFVVPPTIPADTYAYIKDRINWAFQLAGVSFDGQGSGPPRNLSGVAFSAWSDLGTERYSKFVIEYEKAHCELADLLRTFGRKLYNKIGDGFMVTSEVDKNTVEQIPWKDIDMDPKKDAYTLKVFSASHLSNHPAGRLQQIIDMQNAGMITPAEGRDLQAMPDLERFNDLENSTVKLIDKMVDRMLREGIYMPPEPTMDHQLMVKKVTNAIHRAEISNVPEKNVALLRKFVTQAQAMLQQQQRKMMQAQLLEAQAAAPPAVNPDGSNPNSVERGLP